MIYLATPYSFPDPAVRHERFLMACQSAARFMAAGIPVFCPVAHSHPLALAGCLPLGWDFWQHFDRWFIERCDLLVVVMLPGWDVSQGVAAEVTMAEELGKQVIYTAFGDEVEMLTLAESSDAPPH